MLEKQKPIRSNALRKSANGEKCTFNIVGVCNHNNETTVLCHLPDESKGMARKADDIVAAFGCSSCHSVVDGAVRHPEYNGNELFYNNRARVRTWRRWIDLGLITVEGLDNE